MNTTNFLVDIEEMEQLLKLANPKVKKNVTIETPDTLGVPCLLHIALDKRTTLFPNISKRAGQNEDNTLPRVHASASLAGCWYGYASGGYMASNYAVSEAKKKQSVHEKSNSIYKGGFYIHEIPFRCALKPNVSLVYDADLTDEIWLTTYNELTRAYKPTIIGYLFPSVVSFIPRSGTYPIEISTLCVKIEKGSELRLPIDNEKSKEYKPVQSVLNEGYWQFEISAELGINNLKVIKEKEFMELKLKTAGNLSYQ